MSQGNKELVIYPDGRMDTENAALYLCLSVKTLAAMRCKGTGPQFKKIGRIYYYKEHLDAWLDSFKACSSTQQARLQNPSLTKALPQKERGLKAKESENERG